MNKSVVQVLASIAVGIMFILSSAFMFGGSITSGISKAAQHYNLVFTNATVPVNIAALNVWASPDTTYFWYGRVDTFQDKVALGKHVNLVGDAGKRNIRGMPKDQIQEMKQVVRKLYKANRNNTFTLYVTDYAIEVPMKVFYENGIPEKKFDVVLCSDGSGSYTAIKSFLNGENQEKILADKVAEVDEMIKKSKKNKYLWRQGTLDFAYWSHTIAYATKKNVTLFLQEAPSGTTGIATGTFAGIDLAVAKNINFVGKTLKTLVEELSAYGGKAAGDTFRQAMFGDTLADMFEGRDGKKPLIVTGTSYAGENKGFTPKTGENDQFETAMNKIKEVYGDEYFFIYKGHPAWPTHEGYENSGNWKATDGISKTDFNNRVDYMARNFDFEIPAQIPAEMIMLFYMDDYTLNFGGYDSSLFKEADANAGSTHNVLFFITPGSAANGLDGLGHLSAANQTIYSANGFVNDKGVNAKFLTPGSYATFGQPAA